MAFQVGSAWLSYRSERAAHGRRAAKSTKGFILKTLKDTNNKKRRLAKFAGVAVLAAASLTGITSFGSAANAAPAGTSDSHPSKEARFQALTDAQKTCLSNAGLSRPSGRPTSDQGNGLFAAAKQCGIEIPANVGNSRPANVGGRPASVGGRAANVGGARPSGVGPGGARFAQLTDAQRSCLTASGLSRPTARPTAAQFQQVRQAAAKCGITTPTGFGARG